MTGPNAVGFRLGSKIANRHAMTPGPLQQSAVCRTVIGCAIEVHRHLGAGLLESTYSPCLAYELTQQRLRFRVQVPVPVTYKGIDINCSYRADFIVEDTLLIELKSVERLLPIHDAQVLTYLKLTGAQQALLMNFNVPRLVDGLRSFLGRKHLVDMKGPEVGQREEG